MCSLACLFSCLRSLSKALFLLCARSAYCVFACVLFIVFYLLRSAILLSSR